MVEDKVLTIQKVCDHLGLYYILHIQSRNDDDGDEGMGQGGRRGEGFCESVAVSP